MQNSRQSLSMQDMPRAKKHRRGRPSALASLSLTNLVAEIDRRRTDLQQRYDDLGAQVATVDAEIEELGSLTGAGPNARMRGRRDRRGPGRPKGSRNKTSVNRGPKPGRGRGGNEKSLPMVLHGLLQGKTMSVPEMAEAAKSAGHKSKSKNFRTIVSLALLNHKKMFKRVSRGQYTAK
jgi:YD repeat-containing protein